MGVFSWKTQDTNRSIPASGNGVHDTFTVYMHDNKGNVWEEKEYEGYGEFGGKDFYELLAEMNGLPADRDEGLRLAFGSEPFISPNLTQRKDWKWVNRMPEDCEFQGYFYYTEDEEEIDEYW